MADAAQRSLGARAAHEAAAVATVRMLALMHLGAAPRMSCGALWDSVNAEWHACLPLPLHDAAARFLRRPLGVPDDAPPCGTPASMGPLIAWYLHVPWSVNGCDTLGFWHLREQGRRSLDVPPRCALSEASALVVTRALLARYPSARAFVHAVALRRAVALWWPRLTAELCGLMEARQWSWGRGLGARRPEDAWAAAATTRLPPHPWERSARPCHPGVARAGPYNEPGWLQDLEVDTDDVNTHRTLKLWLEQAAANKACYWSAPAVLTPTTPLPDVIALVARVLATCAPMWQRVEVGALLVVEGETSNDCEWHAGRLLQLVAWRPGRGLRWRHCSVDTLRAAADGAVDEQGRATIHVSREWPAWKREARGWSRWMALTGGGAGGGDPLFSGYDKDAHRVHVLSERPWRPAAEERADAEALGHEAVVVARAFQMRRRRLWGTLLLGVCVGRLRRARWEPPSEDGSWPGGTAFRAAAAAWANDTKP